MLLKELAYLKNDAVELHEQLIPKRQMRPFSTQNKKPKEPKMNNDYAVRIPENEWCEKIEREIKEYMGNMEPEENKSIRLWIQNNMYNS